MPCIDRHAFVHGFPGFTGCALFSTDLHALLDPLGLPASGIVEKVRLLTTKLADAELTIDALSHA